ncbi:MAG: PVC-type heme-binding CxxCH protein [Verrucomicrobiota bacterium]
MLNPKIVVARFSAVLMLAAGASAQVDGPLTPEQAIASFKVDPGLRVELVAAEPLVVDPVAVCWDERGRMFVAENRGYPLGPGEGKLPAGMVAMLEDVDNDGRYEKRTDFAVNLSYPNGLMPWRGGLFVTCAPDVYYLKDTDGDGKADVRKVVLTGYMTNSTTQLRVSHPTLGLDGWVYVTAGLTGGKVISPEHPYRTPVQFTKSDSRFNPDNLEIETVAGQGQFGLTFDDFGRKFVCMNRIHSQHIMLEPRYLKRNPHLAFSETVQDTPADNPTSGGGAKLFPLSANVTTAISHAGRFTAACAVTIFRGSALSPEYYGRTYTCDPAGNLVHEDKLVPNGATFTATRTREGVEFLASPDNWFRPVYLANGPDGAFYVCDMYRKTIEHPQYLPEAVRGTVDFTSGKDKGRIWRIVGDKSRINPAQRARVKELAAMKTKQLCAELAHPDAWWRDSARRLLIEQNDPAAVPILRGMVNSGKTEQARVIALRLLDRFNALEDAQIKLGLADKSAGVRENAAQLAEPRLAKSPELFAGVLKLADDDAARVRFVAALALGEVNDARIIPALAKVGVRDAADRWARAAVLSSAGTRSDELMQATLTLSDKANDDLPLFMEQLGQVVGAGQSPDKLVGLLSRVTASSRSEDYGWQVAAVGGIADAARARGIRGKETSALMNLLAGDSIEAKQTRERIQDIFKQAVTIVGDRQQPANNRLAAIGLLAHADFGSAGKALLGLIGPVEPADLQTAAVRSLSQMNDAEVGKALLARERWRAYSPGLREAVVAAMLSHPRYITALLDAIESGTVQTWALTPQRRTALQKNRDKTIAARAEALFKNSGAGDRMKVYEEYKTVLQLKMNGKSGHAVFTRTCAQCHVYGAEGARVGPELTGARNQPVEALLLHIIVPDLEVVTGFTSYEIETKDGRTLTGLLASETPTSVTLRAAQGIEETILRGNIASMSSTSLSLMPQELEKTMTKQELADLLAFLKGE